MTNHVHLVVVPDAPDAPARTLARAHAEYDRHVNIRARTSGHFWQARYFSRPLDRSCCWNALAYMYGPVLLIASENQPEEGDRAAAHPWGATPRRA